MKQSYIYILVRSTKGVASCFWEERVKSCERYVFFSWTRATNRLSRLSTPCHVCCVFLSQKRVLCVFPKAEHSLFFCVLLFFYYEVLCNARAAQDNEKARSNTSNKENNTDMLIHVERHQLRQHHFLTPFFGNRPEIFYVHTYF